MINRKTSFLIFIWLLLSVCTEAQGWKIKNYDVGYRVFEVNSIGNNPTTVTPLLKDPITYQAYLNSITSNSLFGNSEILKLHTFYFNVQLQKNDPLSLFWKRWNVQTGLVLTSRITHDAGAVAYESYYSAPSNILSVYKYSLTNKQQFIGINIGLNKRLRMSRKLDFSAGLHTQGSFAITNYYIQRLDSSTYTPSMGWQVNTTQMPDLKGKNLFQWQAMIPLALEYKFKANPFAVRLEADVGIVGNRYRSKSFAAREAHGIGIWLVFRPYL